jgi:hypothetical protein
MAIAKFDHLVHLTLALGGSKVDTLALRRIAEIPSLQSLVLAQQSLNDAALTKTGRGEETT